VSVLYILIGILMFGVLVALHELGHFTAAKLFGIKVNEYAVGMGPAILRGKRGETEYSLRALPIGGFCAIEGEDGESEDPRAFTKKPLWQRFIVLAAGAFMNLLVGFLIVLAIYLASALSGSYVVADSTLDGFMDGFPLEGESGLMAGDRILSVNGWGVNNPRDLTVFLSLEGGDTVTLTVRRDGKKVVLRDLPLTKRVYVDPATGEEGLYYGLYFRQVELTPGIALRETVYDCEYYVRMVWLSLRYLLTGKAGVKDLSGPVGLVKAMGDVGSQSETVGEGLTNVFGLVAFIAVNLGMVNLLPIPALDGCYILFSIIEIVIRRRLPYKLVNALVSIFFYLLLALIVYITFFDGRRIFRLLKFGSIKGVPPKVEKVTPDAPPAAQEKQNEQPVETKEEK
jgi:regulator of sigma E protease